MLALKYLAGTSTVLMDLPKFDTKDNSLMLWHCGTSPFDMADDSGVTLDRHYFADYTSEDRYRDVGPITDVVFRPGDLTVFRFTGEGENFYYLTGDVFNDGKKTFNGSRGWVKNLRLYDKPIDVLDLMNTFLVNGLPHHYPMVLKDVGKYIEELAYWKSLKKIRKAAYRDYMYVSAP
jgi:L-fucose isomerase-like protein